MTMSIRLPIVINSTPDSIQSKLCHGNEKINKYIWRFRNKTNKGIHLIITPFKDNKDINWCIKIFNVEWNGEDYTEDNKPLYTHTESKFNEAISCANKKITHLFENEYNHINN